MWLAIWGRKPISTHDDVLCEPIACSPLSKGGTHVEPKPLFIILFVKCLIMLIIGYVLGPVERSLHLNKAQRYLKCLRKSLKIGVDIRDRRADTVQPLQNVSEYVSQAAIFFARIHAAEI